LKAVADFKRTVHWCLRQLGLTSSIPILLLRSDVTGSLILPLLVRYCLFDRTCLHCVFRTTSRKYP